MLNKMKKGIKKMTTYIILERVFDKTGDHVANKTIGKFSTKPKRKLKKNQAIFKLARPVKYDPRLAFPAAHGLGVAD